MSELILNKIYQGDCLEVLKTFPDESVDCVITSPPYYALRNYEVEGQLGLEPTYQEYINKLLNIFDEVKRVLKQSGTCWVNLGDSYGTKKEMQKCLLQIPSRFSIGMTDRGWILRNELIWYKPNCMPSSVKDRFTIDFEKIFFFVKNKKYWFETQYEKQVTKQIRRITEKSFGGYGQATNPVSRIGKRLIYPNEQGKNKRCVWKVTTKPFKEAHFATYPESLIETPIKAGCPEFICDKCGKPKKNLYKNKVVGKQPAIGGIKHVGKNGNNTYSGNTEKTEKEFIGYSDCGCHSTYSAGIVLDPFMGAGTTGIVALRHNRNYIGIELNSKYIELAEKRIKPLKQQLKQLTY